MSDILLEFFPLDLGSVSRDRLISFSRTHVRTRRPIEQELGMLTGLTQKHNKNIFEVPGGLGVISAEKYKQFMTSHNDNNDNIRS